MDSLLLKETINFEITTFAAVYFACLPRRSSFPPLREIPISRLMSGVTERQLAQRNESSDYHYANFPTIYARG